MHLKYLQRHIRNAKSLSHNCRFYSALSTSRIVADEANAVILGGGAVGTSIAYHLSKGGLSNVVLLESKTIASGSTSHTPGLISYFHPVPRFWRILSYSIDLYSRIEAETGHVVYFPKPGTLRITRNPERVDEFKYFLSRLDTDIADILEPKEIQKLFPLLNTDGVICALHTKGDGYVDTIGLAVALAAAAQKHGATVIEKCGTNVKTKLRADGLWDVETGSGTIKTKHVINAAGLWAKDSARTINLDLPLVHVEHQHGLSSSISSLQNQNLPVLHDIDNRYYIRQEHDKLLFGAFEDESHVRILEDWSNLGVPKDVLKTTLTNHFANVDQNYNAALKTLPELQHSPIAEKYAGVVCMSPDCMPMVGPVMGFKNYWVAVGFFDGLSTAGGIGKYLADWIIDKEPPFELVETDPNRFDFWADKKFRHAKTRESYAFTYAPNYPAVDRPAGRPTCRVSGIYGALISRGAKMQFTCGWENPTHFGDDREAAIKNEYDLIMTNAGLLDLAWMSKIEIRGYDAANFLNYVLSNRPPELNRVEPSLMLTPKGNIISFVRCIHHDANQSVYILVGNPDQENRNMRWLQDVAAERKYNVEINDVSEYLAVIGTGGPRARECLSELTKEDLSDEKYPYLAAKPLRIAGVPVIGCRISESGESGWQLYHNRADSLKIYEAVMRAGKKLGFATIGWEALNVLRIEKGFKRWGVELNLDHNPLEAGVDDMVDMSKGGFIGYEAMEKLKEQPLTKKLMLLTLDGTLPRGYKLGHEKVDLNGTTIGRVTSGCFSFAIQKYLCFAYVSPDVKPDQKLMVQILGQPFEATVLQEPPVKPYYERLETH